MVDPLFDALRVVALIVVLSCLIGFLAWSLS